MWAALTLTEQTQVAALLIERVSYDGADGKVAFTSRPTGTSAVDRVESNRGAMPEPKDEAGRGMPPLVAYAIASTLLWAAIMPLADWATGDLAGVGKSILKGAVLGLLWGLSMFWVERWLRRRGSK